ncbi:unnamed protein product [Vitrella brassicaformis CCMP3155]|uniref:Alpha 1,4-glycosyltransferase domain-containing protein n=1 Tax=Vitrella brassicaformis (strain CCMP3155) TaxID=1169540 RepID=A0A0G4GKU3_VITBC|nr:unnamed protein product [Vitrella brassicaformis CCMP3155]|eukprot:CEM30654.1 unnamed protein product [Vitrella brassicaformis CCMP3155]
MSLLPALLGLVLFSFAAFTWFAHRVEVACPLQEPASVAPPALLRHLHGAVLDDDDATIASSSSSNGTTIPRQVFLTVKDKNTMKKWQRENLARCKRVNPGWNFNVYDDSGMDEYVTEGFPELLDVWGFFKNVIEKKDFWSYLIVYDRGGLFMDSDIHCRRPLDELLSDSNTRGLIGVEKADGGKLEFAQWSYAFAPRHAIPLTTLMRIKHKVEEIKAAGASDTSAVFLTGPITWTDAILEYMYLFGMGKETVIEAHSTARPQDRVVGDVRLLSVNRFAAGQPHSHATRRCSHPDAFLIHQFSGQWKNHYQWYTADGKPPATEKQPWWTWFPERGDNWRPRCFTIRRFDST